MSKKKVTSTDTLVTLTEALTADLVSATKILEILRLHEFLPDNITSLLKKLDTSIKSSTISTASLSKAMDDYLKS